METSKIIKGLEAIKAEMTGPREKFIDDAINELSQHAILKGLGMNTSAALDHLFKRKDFARDLNLDPEAAEKLKDKWKKKNMSQTQQYNTLKKAGYTIISEAYWETK